MSRQITSFQLSIAEPCHESWNKMTPAELGRFCASCQKQVIDFTVMTDAEIFSYFQQSAGNTCGRFFNKQLQREVALTKPGRALRIKWWWVAFISGVLFATKAKAQRVASYGDTVVITGKQIKKHTDVMGMVAPSLQTIKGRVVDDDGVPLAGASILITGSIYTAITDSQGVFSIAIPATFLEAEIEVSCLGYNKKREKVDWNKGMPNGGERIEIVLGMADAQLMGEVVIVGYVQARPHKPKLDWSLLKKKLLQKNRY